MASDQSNKWFANRGQLIQAALAAVAVILSGRNAWPDMKKIEFLSGASILFYLLAAGVLLWIGRAWRLAGMGPSPPSPASVPDARRAEEAYQRFLRVGVTNFYANRKQVPNDDWVKWLRSAKRRCILLGHAHGEWCKDPGFRPALIDRLRNRVQVEIFFLNPDGLAAQLRHKEDSTGLRDTKKRIRRSLRVVWAIRNGLEPSAKERLKLYVYDATPSLGVTWIDDFMVVTHYLASFTNLTSPALVVEPGPYSDTLETLYAVYEQDVEGIRANFSAEITNGNIENFAPEDNDGQTT